MSEGKFFALRSRESGKVVDLHTNGATGKRDVVLWTYTEADSQHWYYDYVGCTIRNKADDKLVLSVADDRLVMDEFHRGEIVQRWHLQGDQLRQKENPTKVMDIEGENDNGARLCIQDDDDSGSQQWEFNHVEPIACFIRNAKDEKVLDLKAGNTEKGTKVILYDKKYLHEASNQLWYEDKFGIIHVHSNDMVFDTKDGQLEINYFDSELPHRCWVRFGDRIVMKDDPGQVLEVKGGALGKKIRPYKYTGEENQKWAFDYVSLRRS